MADVEAAWLVEADPSRAPRAHAIGDAVTVGGPGADLALFHESCSLLSITQRGDTWFASGAWWLDNVELVGEQPLYHGATLSFGAVTYSAHTRLRFLRGEAESVVDEERYLQTILDPMTGLFNRRFWNAHQRRLEHAALLMIDLDLLKRINDRYGFVGGDTTLMRTAEILRTEVRWRDLAVRYGGEEFLVVLPGATIEHARRFAERLRELHEPSVTYEGEMFAATVSIGVATGSVIEDVIRQADDNLQQAKQQGRNRVVG